MAQPGYQAPPPSPPPPPYQPPPAFPAQQPSGPWSPAPSAFPGWLDLGMIVVVLGGLLILIGFILGCVSVATTTSAAQGELEAFFVLTGVGIFLVILGWMLRVMMVYRKSPQVATPSYAAPSTGTPPTAPAAPPVPAAPPPPGAPATTPAIPNCTNCGRPTTYIAQYGRYYCYSCNRYV